MGNRVFLLRRSDRGMDPHLFAVYGGVMDDQAIPPRKTERISTGSAHDSGVWRIFDQRWLAILFLICALPTGLRLALLTPMGQVADEPTHIARADGLLAGQIVGHRLPLHDPATNRTFDISGVMANNAIVAASGAELPPGLSFAGVAAHMKAAAALHWSKTTMFDFASNTVQYFPFFYLPGTIGIGLGRLVGQGPLNALFAGRLMMVLSYATMGFAALMVARWGRPVLFLLLTMPIALSLGASFNQDGQLLAATALAGALLTRDPVREPKHRLLGIILIVLMICSKPPYGLLLFAALVPLARPHLVQRTFRLSLFALAPILWVAIMMAFSMVAFHSAPYHAGPFWPGSPDRVFYGTDPAGNLRVLLAHPVDAVLMPMQVIGADWSNLLHSAVGILGWLSIPLQPWQYIGWYGATIAAICGLLAAPDTWRSRPADRWLVAALIVGSFFAVALAQYLSWTNVGATAIKGVTGRYFLLFLPFLLFVVPGFGPRIDRFARQRGLGGGMASMLEFSAAVPAIVMAALDIYALPALIVRTFHG